MPGLPFALPFERLHGDLTFEDDGSVSIAALGVDGPMLVAAAHGRLGPGDPSRAALDVEVEVERADATLVDLLRSLGVPFGPGGRGRMRLQGSLAAPSVLPLGG